MRNLLLNLAAFCGCVSQEWVRRHPNSKAALRESVSFWMREANKFEHSALQWEARYDELKKRDDCERAKFWREMDAIDGATSAKHAEPDRNTNGIIGYLGGKSE